MVELIGRKGKIVLLVAGINYRKHQAYVAWIFCKCFCVTSHVNFFKYQYYLFCFWYTTSYISLYICIYRLQQVPISFCGPFSRHRVIFDIMGGYRGMIYNKYLNSNPKIPGYTSLLLLGRALATWFIIHTTTERYMLGMPFSSSMYHIISNNIWTSIMCEKVKQVYINYSHHRLNRNCKFIRIYPSQDIVNNKTIFHYLSFSTYYILRFYINEQKYLTLKYGRFN